MFKKTHTLFFFFRARDFLLPGFLQSAVQYCGLRRSKNSNSRVISVSSF